MQTLRSMIRWMLATGALVGGLTRAGSAQASPNFPTELADRLGMDCPPPCTICHATLSGGFGTIEHPFGIAMYDAGLRGKKTDTLGPALAALEGGGGTAGSGGSAGSGATGGSGGSSGADAGADDGGATDGGSEASGAGGSGTGGSGATGGSPAGAVDSDSDGIGDVEELRQNQDPNAPGVAIKCGPAYGCGARVEPRGRIDGIALAAAIGVALGLFAFGRRRR
jgi:hypothetical protein